MKATLKAAFTVTLLAGMVKVYLPFFSVSLISLSLLSRTVRVRSAQFLSGVTVRVTVVPLEALLRLEVTSPFLASSTTMG